MKSAQLKTLPTFFMLALFGCQQASPTERVSLPPTHTAAQTTIVSPTSAPPTETDTATILTPTEETHPTVTPEPTHTGFDLGDSRIRSKDGMVMVYVPPGGFRMGSTNADLSYAFELCEKYYGEVFGPCERRWWQNEQPAHNVILDPYWLDAYEVSNAQYRICVEAGACSPPKRDIYFGDITLNDHPVVYVSWHQASEYCRWADSRLPTEAELEYATRGPESLRFPWGNQFDGAKVNYCDVNCEYDWADESVDDGYVNTSPVGNYPDGVSWCGANDLVGNVWEWAQDWYDATYFSQSSAQNPQGPASGTERVRRGGSWHYSSDGVRGTSRFGVGPDNADNFQGFRCARNLD